ncbi:hypothetical protein JXI42_11740 [bacterium]|nr:hypothetical protein [bacterium]
MEKHRRFSFSRNQEKFSPDDDKVIKLKRIDRSKYPKLFSLPTLLLILVILFLVYKLIFRG